MRHLLSVIVLLIVGTIGWMVLADKCGRNASPNDIADEEEVMTIDPEESDENNGTGYVYYGDTLFQFSGKTVVIDYTDVDKEVSSMSSSQIVTYVDTSPVSRSRVIGNGTYFVEGPVLKFAIGVDTVRYNMRDLPATLNPVKALLQGNVVEHKFARSFALSDSSCNCDFKFLAYLPESHPTWLNQFIAIVMRNDIQAMYLDNKGADRILKEYYGIKSTPKKIGGINAAGMTPKEIAGHFALEHERLYKDEYPVKEYEGLGPKYDYMMEVSPAWIDKDSTYVTYRFYSYYYTAGMHGFMEEYYLTFNNHSGNLLGYSDLIGKKNFPKAIAVLEKQLTSYRSTWSSIAETYSAALDGESLEANASEIIKEVYNGSYYPRPAITRQGIVFSYQPYEKGAFCDGILHFVQPIQKDFKIQ